MSSEMLKKELIKDLKKVFRYGNIKGIEHVTEVIGLVKELDDLEYYLEDEVVRYWIPCIVDRLFGRKSYKTCKFNKESNETFILINPAFIKLEKSCITHLKSEIPLLSGYNIVESQLITFSKELICYLYGGFKWFDSYVRVAEEEEIIGEPAIVYFIKGDDVLVDKTNKFKNKYREQNEKIIINKIYDDLDYRGIIRPFHVPDKIENEVQKDIVKRLSYNRFNQRK